MPVEGEAAVEAGDGLPEEREAAVEEGDGLPEGEAAVEEGDGLPEEREALEEATGAFLVEEAGCLERLLEEKGEHAGEGAGGAEARDKMAAVQV